MVIIKDSMEMQNIIKSFKYKKSIGFVPTMGALHDGHKSLIKEARQNNDIVVVSIFINPLQFGVNEDYSIYPRVFEQDSKICEDFNVDYIFYPSENDFYEKNHLTYVKVNKISDILCGLTRKGHFEGVCTVVNKLFNIIKPDNAYFGKKDFQQYMILKKMVSDLSIDINVIGLPIVRDDDGLAKSSRNKYLSHKERKSSLYINKALFKSIDLVKNNNIDIYNLKSSIIDIIKEGKENKIEYVEIIDTINFEPAKKLTKNTLVAVAVFCGKTRLIDNIFFKDFIE